MASHQPLVSVIMPFYNTLPAFMVEAIESVRAQSYGGWELLLIDDGSTNEASSNTAQKYAAAHAGKIHYLQSPGCTNQGPGAARQLALKQAKGDLVAFLDADDIWLPTKLSEQTLLLSAHDEVGALYGRTKYWYSWTGEQADFSLDVVPALGVPDGTIIPPPALLTQFVEQRMAIPCTCSIIVRRELLLAAGGFERGIRNFFYDDQMFYAKICVRAPLLAVDRCWDCYRQHPESGTHRSPDATQQLHLAYLRWLDLYLQQEGIHDQQLGHAVRRQLWLYGQPGWLPHSLSRPLRLGKKWLLRMQAGFRPVTKQADRRDVG